MPVPTQVSDLSTTIASNSPAGSDNVFPDLDNHIRALAGMLASVATNSATNGYSNPYLPNASAAVFNEAGADIDFRAEGDTDANLLFLDASTDRVGVGTSTPDAKLTVNGVGAFGDGAVGTPSISNTGDLNTGIWFPAADTVAVSTGGAEVARFDSSGNLGIGTSSPAYKLDVRGVTASGNGTITTGFSFDTGGLVGTFSNHALGILTNGAVVARFDTSGNLGLGVTPSAWASYKAVQVGPIGSLSSVTGATIVGNNWFYDGASKYITTATATIYEQGAGTHAWYTAPSGTAGNTISFTQAMTLDASGNLGVGTTSPSGYRLRLNSTDRALYVTTAGATAALPAMYLSDSTHSVDGVFTPESGQLRFGSFTSHPVVFVAGNTERARITSGGDLLVPSAGSGSTGRISVRKDTGVPLAVSNEGATGTLIEFSGNGSGALGSITHNGTNVAYNTSSDYRLKDNPQPLTGSGAFIDALQPKTWEWKTDGSLGVGFIAHEVQAVSPGSVVGEKDAVDADGNPVMQAMEYGSAEFIANIIAELQSLRARVAALEAQP